MLGPNYGLSFAMNTLPASSVRVRALPRHLVLAGYLN